MIHMHARHDMNEPNDGGYGADDMIDNAIPKISRSLIHA